MTMMMMMVWRFNHIESSLAMLHWNNIISSLFVSGFKFIITNTWIAYPIYENLSVYISVNVYLYVFLCANETVNECDKYNTIQKINSHSPFVTFRWKFFSRTDEKCLFCAHEMHSKQKTKIRYNQWHKWSTPTLINIYKCISECDRIELICSYVRSYNRV